ncbi:HNH endonuclease [Nonomuraea sp. NPDC049269]|uniref:HNH endonuclease n=1 Tax=Nonomuraea sp. NPDC049269 TaxID=3364349 RepID=UPI00371F852D
METSCCSKATFASEEEARRYWRRMEGLGLSRVLPTDVEQCMRGWHLTFPAKEQKPRKPLKRSGAKKLSRPKSVPSAVKRILLKRSGGACEVGLVCGGRAEGTDPAHREGKGTGGTDKAWSNLASNLLWACRACHDLIDNKQPARAEKLGLKVRAGVARPWEIPVLHERFRWVLLHSNGGVRVAPAGTHPDGKRPIPVVACAMWDLINGRGALVEAVKRFGHADCPPRSAPREGLFTCSCGSSPFVVEVAS